MVTEVTIPGESLLPAHTTTVIAHRQPGFGPVIYFGQCDVNRCFTIRSSISIHVGQLDL